MTPQEAEFAARVARIEQKTGTRRTTLYVGPDDHFVVDRPDRTRRTRLGTLMRNAGYPLSMVLSFLLGFLAFGIGRWVRYHLTGVADVPPDPDMEMMIELGLGLGVAVLLSQLDRLVEFEHLVAKALGVAIGLLGFHNLVHLFPDPFAMLFSNMWVTRMISTTEAQSLLWRGISFTF